MGIINVVILKKYIYTAKPLYSVPCWNELPVAMNKIECPKTIFH